MEVKNNKMLFNSRIWFKFALLIYNSVNNNLSILYYIFIYSINMLAILCNNMYKYIKKINNLKKCEYFVKNV